jgi:hemolysin III
MERPALRGALHLAGAVFAAFGAAWLLVLAGTPAGYVGAAIFGTSLVFLYATSATYHQVRWPERWRRVVKRLDHSAIFIFIAGSYTPFCLHVSTGWGIPMLAVVWSIAGAGVLLKLLWPDGPRWLSVAMYVGFGWVALAAVPEVIEEYSIDLILMLLAGGALYTIGGICYALRWPDPWPRVFGYHEVFHAFVVAASAVYFAAVAVYVL